MEETDRPLAKRARCGLISWASLHHDVLVSIAELLSVPDYVRFGAVCRTWATAAKAASISSYSHSPWLLFKPETDQSHPIRLYLLNHPDHTYYHVIIPSDTRVVGQKEGWIVLIHQDSEPILLNPATGAVLQLPSFSGVLFGDPDSDVYPVVTKVVLSAVPSFATPYVALAILAEPTPGLEHLYFARSDDQGWTHLYSLIEEEEEEEEEQDDMITGAIYHQGKFLVLFHSGKLFSYDFSSGTSTPPTLSILVNKEEEVAGMTKFLVSAPHGSDLLQVRLRRCPALDRINYIRMMKFDPETNKWVKVEDLGNSCLFMDEDQAMLSFDITDLQRNCIYFTDQFHDSRKQLITMTAVYDLKKSSAKCWLPSKMQPICPSNTIPIWFVPSLL